MLLCVERIGLRSLFAVCFFVEEIYCCCCCYCGSGGSSSDSSIVVVVVVIVNCLLLIYTSATFLTYLYVYRGMCSLLRSFQTQALSPEQLESLKKKYDKNENSSMDFKEFSHPVGHRWVEPKFFLEQKVKRGDKKVGFHKFES